MSLTIVEVTTDSGHVDTLRAIAEQQNALDCWETGITEDDRCTVRILVRMQERQPVLDAIQKTLSGSEKWRAVIIAIEGTVPKAVPPADEEESDGSSAKPSASVNAISREELYQNVSEGARLGHNYFLMVAFSTVIAALGMTQNSVAIVIGSMVIAPFLGPQLAFSFATAIGDWALMGRALAATVLGLGIAIAISAILGYVQGSFVQTPVEILVRTMVGFDGIAIALASGAAATLALTTGRSMTLIGVMVAVALLPPAVVLGLMLGTASFDLAKGAALLLAVNIACINIAAQIVFIAKGIRPRTEPEKAGARLAMTLTLTTWAICLLILAVSIYVNS